MRVAVIGAGVSGLVASYVLRREHEVELFEADSRAGGHANTVLIQDEHGHDLPLDVGFIVYCERTYPVFSRLLRELGVETQLSDMSFGVRTEPEGLEFSSRGVRGYLAQPRNLLNPTLVRAGLDVLRFQREAREVLDRGEAPSVGLEEYLRQRGYGQLFRERIIIPLIASTWSNSPADVLGFPVGYLFRFLEQHGVLARDSIPEWRWIVGGAHSYVRRILEAMPEGAVHLDTPVKAVRRDGEGVTLVTAYDVDRRFDAVVLACHADQALTLLDASAAETRALEGFGYARNAVVLHTDQRVLPRNPWARAAWNYLHVGGRDLPDTLTMSYDLNRLQGIGGATHYCVSVNPGEDLDPSRVIATFQYSHPVYSMRTLEAQRQVEALQGANRTYYAGAHLGYGFHEDGAASGLQAAERLGVRW